MYTSNRKQYRGEARRWRLGLCGTMVVAEDRGSAGHQCLRIYALRSLRLEAVAAVVALGQVAPLIVRHLKGSSPQK
jgi:hypothetical protein